MSTKKKPGQTEIPKPDNPEVTPDIVPNDPQGPFEEPEIVPEDEPGGTSPAEIPVPEEPDEPAEPKPVQPQ